MLRPRKEAEEGAPSSDEEEEVMREGREAE